jgi:hypothetical protein
LHRSTDGRLRTSQDAYSRDVRRQFLGERMTAYPAQAAVDAAERHRVAVANTLGWAQEAAERGNYADALEWVRTVEAIGEQLPPGYHSQRQAWRSALAQNAADPEGS